MHLILQQLNEQIKLKQNELSVYQSLPPVRSFELMHYYFEV